MQVLTATTTDPYLCTRGDGENEEVAVFKKGVKLWRLPSYLRIKWDREKGKYPVALPHEKYLVEVEKDKLGERFRYHKMMKAPDRHLYNLC